MLSGFTHFLPVALLLSLVVGAEPPACSESCASNQARCAERPKECMPPEAVLNKVARECGRDEQSKPVDAAGSDEVREEYCCETCKSFAPLVRAFELRFLAAKNEQEQGEALNLIRFDPQVDPDAEDAYVYSYGVETLQKDTKTDTYTVRLTFRCRCSSSKVIPMTLVIKGVDNYYHLFLE